MRTFHYECEVKKDAAKETILYGVIWVFLAVLISGMPYLKNENDLLYNSLSIVLLVVGVRKLIRGIIKLK